VGVVKIETPYNDNDLILTPIISPQSGWQCTWSCLELHVGGFRDEGWQFLTFGRCLQHPCFKNLCKIAQASKNSDSNAQHFLSDLLTNSWFHSMLFALLGYQFPYTVMNTVGVSTLVSTCKLFPSKFPLHLGGFVHIHTKIQWTSGLHGNSLTVSMYEPHNTYCDFWDHIRVFFFLLFLALVFGPVGPLTNLPNIIHTFWRRYLGGIILCVATYRLDSRPELQLYSNLKWWHWKVLAFLSSKGCSNLIYLR
jgi:hypothetical protein